MTGILEVFGYLVCQTQLTKRNILCKHNTNNCSKYISALQLLNCGEHCVINNADLISALRINWFCAQSHCFDYFINFCLALCLSVGKYYNTVASSIFERVVLSLRLTYKTKLKYKTEFKKW